MWTETKQAAETTSAANRLRNKTVSDAQIMVEATTLGTSPRRVISNTSTNNKNRAAMSMINWRKISSPSPHTTDQAVTLSTKVNDVGSDLREKCAMRWK